MSCKCQKPKTAPRPQRLATATTTNRTAVDLASREAPRPVQRSRAIMCQFCIFAEHDPVAPWGKGAVQCTISGKPVAQHVKEPLPTCPRRRHGVIVHAFFTTHYYAPMLLRLMMRRRLTGPVAGCGCIKPLKDRWERFKAWRRGRPATCGRPSQSGRG